MGDPQISSLYLMLNTWEFLDPLHQASCRRPTAPNRTAHEHTTVSRMPSIIQNEDSELCDTHLAPTFPTRESGIGDSQVYTNYLDERRIATLAAADNAKLE